MSRLNKLLLIGFLACIAFVSDGRQWTRAQTGSRENLDTALLDAAKKGNEREVERLLREGVGPDVIEENSLRTPLFYAVQQGQTGMVRLLLDRKADPNLKDRGGITPLLIAARGTDKTRNEIVQMLIAAKADIDGRSVYGETAMQLAAERGFTDTVLLLLDKGATANVSSAVNIALLKAAGSGKLDEIHQLLNRGANPNAQPIARNASGQTTYRGNTPLIEAVTNGHKNVALALLEAKADINLAGFGGRTPLIAAVHQGPEFTKLLLDAGARPSLSDDSGKTPIMHVMMSAAGPQDRRQTLLLLIRAGADVNAQDKNGETATRLAVATGKTDLLPMLGGGGAKVDKQTLYSEALVLAERQRLPEIHALLSKGNNPNVADKDGRSPLIIATSFGRLEMISALLQAGSNIDQQDNKGVTALMYAIRARRLDIAQMLLSAGAKTNIKNNAGDTALTMAIPTRNEAFGARSSSVTLEKTAPELVKALLQAGADPNVKPFGGVTPLMLAAARGASETVKALLAHGADVNAKAEFGLTAYHVAIGEDVIDALNVTRAQSKRSSSPIQTNVRVANDLLMEAAWHGNTDLVRKLIVEEKADPNYRGELRDETLLRYAIRSGNSKTVETILKNGADPKSYDSALKFALEWTRPGEDNEATLRIVSVLVNEGANINAGEVSALAFAASRGLVKITEFFTGRGGDPRIKDKHGRNALLYTLDQPQYWRLPEVVQALLKAGVDKTARDNGGRSALDTATARGKSEIVSLLKEAK